MIRSDAGLISSLPSNIQIKFEYYSVDIKKSTAFINISSRFYIQYSSEII